MHRCAARNVFSETRQFRTAVGFAIKGMVNVQLTAAVFSSISNPGLDRCRKNKFLRQNGLKLL